MTRVEGAFEVTSWSEEPVEGLDGTAKVMTVSIGQRFSGGIEAETIADMVMTYRDDGTADFVGYQRVQGRLGDRIGSFVLQSLGGYDGTVARSRFEVVPESGREGLVGLSGSGEGAAAHGTSGTYNFDYTL